VRIEILDEAEKELDDGVAYYEKIEPGLGVRLKAETREIIQWIVLNPELPRLRSKGYRRVNLKVFPYYVAYFIWSETVWIVATAHSKRRPEYWIRRKSHIPNL
jgi:hypothetical protein